MARFSMNEMTTFRWPFERDVREYAAAGFDAIGVWRQKLSDFGERQGIELLAKHDLRVSCLLWAGGFTGSDGRSYRDSIEDAIEATRCAAEMNADCLVVYTGGRAGHTYKHAGRLVRDALAEMAPVAAELGVTLAVEPMHPGCAGAFTLLTSLDDALELLDTLDADHIRLVFDTYHLAQEPAVLRHLPQITPRIAIVQLGDAKQPPRGEQNRCLLGEGRIPLREIVATLADSGYNGYYDVELMGEEIEPVDYHALLNHAYQAFHDLVGSTSG